MKSKTETKKSTYSDQRWYHMRSTINSVTCCTITSSLDGKRNIQIMTYNDTINERKKKKTLRKIFNLLTLVNSRPGSALFASANINAGKRLSDEISNFETIFHTLEWFRFEDEDNYEYEIQLKVFSRIVEKYSTLKASLYYFSPEKLVRLFLLEKF